MVLVNLELALSELISLKFNAAKLWQQLMKHDKVSFKMDILDELTDLGERTPKAIRLFISEMGTKNNDALVQLIEAAYAAGEKTVAAAVEEGIIEACLHDAKNLKAKEEKQLADVVILLFAYFDRQEEEAFTARRREFEEKLKTKSKASFLSLLGLATAATAATDSKAPSTKMPEVVPTATGSVNPKEQHWENVVKTIDANYGIALNTINLQSGELGANLVGAGFLTGSDLNRILKDGNPVKSLVEEYIKMKPSLWQLFLDTLAKSGQEGTATLFKEEYDRIAAENK